MEIETLNHLFWECRHDVVQSFWMKLKDYLNENNIDIEVTVKTITLEERFCLNIKLKIVSLIYFMDSETNILTKFR